MQSSELPSEQSESNRVVPLFPSQSELPVPSDPESEIPLSDLNADQLRVLYTNAVSANKQCMVVIEDYESRARQVVINWGKMVAECKRLESELVKGNAVIRAQGDENARLHSTLKYLNEVCDDLQRKARGKKSLVVDANGRSVSGLYPNEGN